MKKRLYLLLALALCFGTACAAGEFDWLKEWDDCEFEASTPDAYRVEKDGKWGFVDGEGKVLIEPKYDIINSFFGFADVFELTEADGKYGFVNNQGREIAPPEYDDASGRIANGLGWLEKDGMYALVNETGLISDFIYEDVYPYWSISAVMKDGKWGMVNADGECPAGFVFDEIDTYSLAGRIGEKYAALDEQGEILLPAEYDQINRPYDSDLVFFVKDGVEGWLNTEDGSYVETQYKGLQRERRGYVRWEYDEKCGFLDLEGNPAAEFDNADVYYFNGEYAQIFGDDPLSSGIVNRSGKLILEPEYYIDGEIDSNNIVCVQEDSGEWQSYQIINDEMKPIFADCISEYEQELRFEAADLGLVYEHRLPDDAARYRAYKEGWEYICTPAAKDAMVFIVNADNPIENLSAEDIRRIYGGFIDDWEQLGMDVGKIDAYQPDQYDYDRRIFMDFMGNAAPMDPETEYYIGSDGDPSALCYRNLPGAIGFCMYSHCAFLPEDVKIISIDGVFPSEENIRSQKYPWTTLLYTVGKGEKIIISRGKIEGFGYIPLD